MATLGRGLVAGLFAVVLTLTVLLEAANVSVELATLCLAYVGFAVCAVAADGPHEGRTGRLAVLAYAGLGLVVGWLVIRQNGGGIPSTDRAFHVVLTFAAIAGFPLATPGARRFVRENLVYVLAFLVVLGTYLYHVAGAPSGSGTASFPVFTGVVFALSLLVAPRYVDRRDFLWIVAGLSGAVVLVGLPAYVVGSYELGPAVVRLWPAPVSFVGVTTGVPALRSIMGNPNTLGLLAFAGAVSALVLLVEAIQKRRVSPVASPSPPALVAGTLCGLGVVGVILSGSRASLLATGVAAGVLLSTVAYGPQGRRVGFVAIAGLVTGALWAVHAGLLPVNPGNRFALWGGALEAIARSESPIGYGLVSGAEIIEPYLSEPVAGYSPHNSYLSIFLRIGIVGGLAHLVLTVGNVLDGALGYPPERAVAPGALALASGFALHQVFETYSLFGFWLGSVLATVAAGYLLTGRAEPGPVADPTIFRWERLSRPPEPARPP